MPYLFAAFVALMLVFAALYFSWGLLLPIAFTGAAAVSAVIVLVEFASASASAFSASAPIDRIRIAPPSPAQLGDRRDPAYRSYFLGPVLYDYGRAVRAAREHALDRLFSQASVEDPTATPLTRARGSLMQQVLEVWHLGTSKPWKVVVSGPLVGATVGLASGAAAAAALGAVVSVTFGLVVVLVVLAASLAAIGLRLFETASLRIRRITVECPSCHHRVARSVYGCPHCPADERAIHRHLLPGSQGVLRRICRCGGSLPTLLIKGKWKLDAFCPECDAHLPVGALTAPTFHIPVVAGPAAGKTIFMMAAIASLESRSRAAPDAVTLTFGDQEAKDEYAKARKSLEQAAFNTIAPTLPAVTLRAHTVYVSTETSPTRLVYVYDPAGERWENADTMAAFRFLGLTQGVIFIVDPFALDPVRALSPDETLTEVSASSVAPEQLFTRFEQGLRESMSIRSDRKLALPIAVVITKADALLRRGAPVPHPYEGLSTVAGESDREVRSKSARTWLEDVGGQRNLVNLIDNNFTKSSYFVVSARDAFSVTVRRSDRTKRSALNDNPSTPLQWLLTPRGDRP